MTIGRLGVLSTASFSYPAVVPRPFENCVGRRRSSKHDRTITRTGARGRQKRLLNAVERWMRLSSGSPITPATSARCWPVVWLAQFNEPFFIRRRRGYYSEKGTATVTIASDASDSRQNNA